MAATMTGFNDVLKEVFHPDRIRSALYGGSPFLMGFGSGRQYVPGPAPGKAAYSLLFLRGKARETFNQTIGGTNSGPTSGAFTEAFKREVDRLIPMTYEEQMIEKGCTCQWFGGRAILTFNPNCPVLHEHHGVPNECKSSNTSHISPLLARPEAGKQRLLSPLLTLKGIESYPSLNPLSELPESSGDQEDEPTETPSSGLENPYAVEIPEHSSESSKNDSMTFTTIPPMPTRES